MTFSQIIEILRPEVIKSIPTFSIACVTLLLGWFVGQRLTVHWNLRQKSREFDLLAAREFYSLYGAFFSTWKLWNYYKREIGAKDLPGASRWEMLKKACADEGAMEALFVRIANKRSLSEEEVAIVGKFRQAYQSMRETIRDDRPLEWNWQEHSGYVSFKRLGSKVLHIILSEGKPAKCKPDECADVLLQLTSGMWEEEWDK